MRLLRLLGHNTLALLRSLRVFWRPMLLLAIVAHIALLRTRLPEDNSVATEPIEPLEEEFIEITALVGDAIPSAAPEDDLDEEEPSPEPGELKEEAPEPEPEPKPEPKPEPQPEPEADPEPEPPSDDPQEDEPDDPPEEEAEDDEENEDDDGDEDDNGGDDGDEDDDGDDNGDDGNDDDGGATRRDEGTGILNVLKDRIYARLTAGGSGVNDPASVQAQLDSFPKVDEVDSGDDQLVLCPGKPEEEICNPIEDGTAFGALRIPQTPLSQAELIVLGGGEDTGILEGLKFSGARLGRIGARGSGNVYHVTQDEGEVEFYLGFVKVFGGGQTFVVLWETNPLE